MATEGSAASGQVLKRRGLGEVLGIEGCMAQTCAFGELQRFEEFYGFQGLHALEGLGLRSLVGLPGLAIYRAT